MVTPHTASAGSQANAAARLTWVCYCLSRYRKCPNEKTFSSNRCATMNMEHFDELRLKIIDQLEEVQAPHCLAKRLATLGDSIIGGCSLDSASKDYQGKWARDVSIDFQFGRRQPIETRILKCLDDREVVIGQKPMKRDVEFRVFVRIRQ
jgi:hypothetical protein